MRDLVLAAIVFGSLPFIFKRPHIGLLMCVWLSVMNPHRLAWGFFSYNVPYVALVAGCTIFSAMMHASEVKRPPMSSMIIWLALFVFWTCVTTFFALDQGESFVLWKTIIKTQVIAFLIPLLIHTKERLQQLIWVIVLSIVYYGAKGGLWILLTGGGERVYGPSGSYIEDNNALAVAVIMMIPLLRYLQQTTANQNVKRGLLGLMFFSGVAVLGSYSRGALLAGGAMLTLLWMKGRNKLAFVVVAVIVLPLVLAFMPATWYARMDTLNAEETHDAKMNPRLYSWATMLNLALDRPLVGGGFAVDTRQVYERYAPEGGGAVYVAHSIYFQALGEHGFVGLFFYLGLLLATYRTASRIIRSTRDRPDLAWARDLSAMMQVTLLGFAAGGAFLSLVNFDVPYYLVMVMVVTKTLVERELRSAPLPKAEKNVATGMGRRQFQ